MSACGQVCKTGHPDVGFVGTVCYEVEWLEIVAENDGENARVLPRAVELLTAQNVRVAADTNLLDLTYHNCNNNERTNINTGK